LLAHIPGGRDVESAIHPVFWPWRVRGEWFEATPALQIFIELAAEDAETRETEPVCLGWAPKPTAVEP